MVTNRKTEGKCWLIGSTRKILGKGNGSGMTPRHSHDDYMQVAYYMDANGWVVGL